MLKVGFSTYFLEHLWKAASYVSKLSSLDLKNLGLTLESLFQKELWKFFQRMFASIVWLFSMFTVRNMCSCWYHSQFNKIEKSWIHVKVTFLDSPKTWGNHYMKARKGENLENCETHACGTISRLEGCKNFL